MVYLSILDSGKAILGSVKIEWRNALAASILISSLIMNTLVKPNPFGNMNRFKALDPDATSAGYRSWKKKETTAEGVPIKKELNVASTTEFPDLVKDTKKNTVFEGTSLATKLKETIAAEEEAAVLKRLKKGDTPEMILRDSCVSLPLKNYKGASEGPLEAPWWVTDPTIPVFVPSFKHKTLEELAEERRWKRLGINPRNTMLIDEEMFDDYEDRISMPPVEIDTLSDTSSVLEETEIT